MESTSLIVVCTIAFVVVFMVLGILAAAMHLITLLFPERVAVVDAALAAAIASTVTALVPGARVTRIEEES